jgi:hypothetical protein
MFKIIKQLVKDSRVISKFWVSSDETWSGLPPFKTEAAAAKKVEELEKPVEIKGRRTLSDFMNTIKDGLIDLFKEEGDKQL